MSTDIVVVDVSHHQGDWPGPDTPWAAMKEAGVVGMILKATEGETFVDSTYQRRYGAAQDNGIAVCSYHFLRHGNIAEQMAHFIDVVAPDPGERMVLDWEDHDVTLEEVREAAAILMMTLNDGELANIQVTIYASSAFLEEHVPNQPDRVLGSTSLWVARYSDEPPYWPEQVWPTWSLWQKTDSFSINDYGPIDGNVFNGSVENCVKWLNPAVVPPDDI